MRYAITRIAVFNSSILSKQCAAHTSKGKDTARRIEAAVERVPEFEISLNRDAADNARPNAAVTAAAAALANSQTCHRRLDRINIVSSVAGLISMVAVISASAFMFIVGTPKCPSSTKLWL